MKSKKIKLVYGLTSFSLGGIENQLLQQLGYLNQDKYEIALITLFYYENRPNFYDLLPRHVKTYPLNFNGYFDIKSYLSLYKILDLIKPDLVISSMFSANSVFRVFKILFRYKLITREHNTYTDKTYTHRVLEKVLSPLSNKIVAVSKDVAVFYSKQNWINSKKIIVINNGIDLSKIIEFKNNNKSLDFVFKELSIKLQDKIIINVARLKKQKDHSSLIDVFGEFQKKHPTYHLCILGGGVEYENLEDKINKMGLKNKIHLLGFRNDVFHFYQASEFFVLSSLIEGFPNVFLEAMSFGLPIVSTNVPGANEIIVNHKNGFIVKNKEELLEKITYLSHIDKTELSQMRKECLRTAEKFDVRLIVGKYESLINELLA